jgi:hypothetical protein
VPFDGTTYPPNSALAILLEADRKLTAERRAAARLRGQPVMPAEKTARHAARASASIEVLDQLEALLADGRSWIQGDYWNDVGGFCLVGGIEFIRAGRREGDAAITYLSRAILGTTASRRRVTV